MKELDEFLLREECSATVFGDVSKSSPDRVDISGRLGDDDPKRAINP
jgi:hypothetical protein